MLGSWASTVFMNTPARRLAPQQTTTRTTTKSPQTWPGTGLCITYCVSFAKPPCDNVVHVSILTELQFCEIHFYFAVLYKHTLFYHLKRQKQVSMHSLNVVLIVIHIFNKASEKLDIQWNIIIYYKQFKTLTV